MHAHFWTFLNKSIISQNQSALTSKIRFQSVLQSIKKRKKDIHIESTGVKIQHESQEENIFCCILRDEMDIGF